MPKQKKSFEKKLKTKFIGKYLHYKESINSTQDFIKNLARRGACEGTVVIAGQQKKGKGRRGRGWLSPQGGIYLSFLLRPKTLSSKNLPQLSLVMALASLEAIRKKTKLGILVKWPNDLFLAGKKIGGILCEADTLAAKINFIAVGMGINVNTNNLSGPANSLFLHTGKKFSQSAIIKEILTQSEKYYIKLEKGQGKKLLKRWQNYCFLKNNYVEAKIYNKIIKGKASGIDQEGCLLIYQDNGSMERVSSCDVVKLTPPKQ